MCGILGINSCNLSITKKDFLESRDLMNHRGPDSSGYYESENKNVMLGHNRLSIIDLSNSAHQPMISFDNRYVITYNGELYNYISLKKTLIEKGYEFNSKSDTEVILNSFHLWKEKSLDKLNGMFSFCIYDKIKDSFFIARDRLGIKPLFYYFDYNNFIFSSELKSILSFSNIDKKINYSSILDYLSFGYTPAPNTVYKKIKKLKPGHFIYYENKKIFQKKYWDIDLKKENYISYDESLETISSLIKNSIKSQLISDVPIGSLLSGGIDSSAVSYYGSLINKNLITCSIGFDDNKFSETNYSRSVAKLIGSDHYESIMSFERSFNNIDNIINIYDEPFADSSALPTLEVSRIAREKMTVALSGDGGDEIFNGYKRYINFEKRKKIPFMSSLKTIPFLKSFLLNKRGERLFRFLSSSNNIQRYMTYIDYFSPFEKRKMVNKDYFDNYDDYYSLKKYWDNNIDLNKQIRYLELKTYLPDDILTKVDRASMHYSLEVRPPLLDHKLVEFCFSLPSHFHIKNHDFKSLLKDDLIEKLPKKIIDRGKKGFSLPWKSWKNKFLDQSKELLINGDLIKSKIISKDYIENNLYNLSGDKLWSLIILEKWFNK
tara:strand:+ start:1344 stop:3155 length:1812 start_codon:yes stop_codon:yes gene_type:complete